MNIAIYDKEDQNFRFCDPFEKWLLENGFTKTAPGSYAISGERSRAHIYATSEGYNCSIECDPEQFESPLEDPIMKKIDEFAKLAKRVKGEEASE